MDVAVVAGPPTYGMYGNPISVDTAVVPAAAPVPTYAPVAAAPPQRSAAYGGEAARGETPPSHTVLCAYNHRLNAGGAYGGYGGGGAVVTSSEVPRHVPIATLNPYSNKWTIKVRCDPCLPRTTLYVIRYGCVQRD